MKKIFYIQVIYCLAIFLVLLIPTLTLAQQSIVGRVYNSKGEPISGAIVSGADTDIGTTTWKDGRFRLSGTQKINTIQCTMPGYTTVEKPATTDKEVIIVLRPETNNTSRPRNAQAHNAQASPLVISLEPQGNAINFVPISSGTIKPVDMIKKPLPDILINSTHVQVASPSGQTLRITTQTGADDLRGSSTAFFFINFTNGTSSREYRLYRGHGMGQRSEQDFQLDAPIKLADIRSITIRHDGQSGSPFEGYDNWNLNNLKIQLVINAAGSTTHIYEGSGSPLVRFNGSQRTFVANKQ